MVGTTLTQNAPSWLATGSALTYNSEKLVGSQRCLSSLVRRSHLTSTLDRLSLSVLITLLSGITSEENLTGLNASTIIPDYVTASIGDLRTAVEE